MIALVACSTDCVAQITGKIYQLGDTITIDGIKSIVFKVDDSGMHGTAMSPYAMTQKELDKLRKQFVKQLEKEVKKGNSTEAEMNKALSDFDNQTRLPVINTEKRKKGRVFKVDEWSKQIPEGWRIPSKQDASDFATFYCGGLGSDHGIKFKFLMRSKDLTSDLMSQANLMMIAFYGMIISDSYDPSDVKFLQRWSKKINGKEWFEIRDKFVGSEKTVAVKDF